MAFLLAIMVWRILLRKTGMPIPGAPYRLGHCCDLYGSAVNLPGHPCGSLKKDNNVCPDRNVPQGHNHGHASRHYPSPLGLNLKSSKALLRPALMEKPKSRRELIDSFDTYFTFYSKSEGGVAMISWYSGDNKVQIVTYLFVVSIFSFSSILGISHVFASFFYPDHIAVVLVSMSLTGCGTLTGIPAHGGGKRYAEEQRLVSASIRAALKDIDVTSLKGKRAALVFDIVADEGGGNMAGGRINPGMLFSIGTMMSPVTSTTSAFQIFNLAEGGANYSNTGGGSSSNASTVTVTNGTGSNSGTSSGTNTGSGTSSGTNTGTSTGSGTNTSNGTSSGTNTNTGTSSGTNTSTGTNTSSGTNTATTGGTTTTGGFDQTGGSTGSGTNTGTSSGSGTNTGTNSNTGSNTSTGTTSGTNTGTNTSSGSNTGTNSGTNSNNSTATSTQSGGGSNSSSTAGGYNTNRQTVSPTATSTETKTEGKHSDKTFSLAYKGLGEYQNMAVPKSDATLLMGLVRNYLLFSGVTPTVPTDPKADVLVYVTVDVFGTVRSRFDALAYNNETVKAETSFEISAFDRDGKMILKPTVANREAQYREHYLMWAGPFVSTERVMPGTGLLVDFTDVDGTKANYNPKEPVSAFYPLGKN